MPEPLVRVKMNTPWMSATHKLQEGQTYSVPESLGKRIVENNAGVYVGAPKAPVVVPVVNTTETPLPKPPSPTEPPAPKPPPKPGETK